MVTGVKTQIVLRQLREIAIGRIKRHPAPFDQDFEPLVRGLLRALIHDDAADKARRNAVRTRERHKKTALTVTAGTTKPQRRQRIGEAFKWGPFDFLIGIIVNRIQDRDELAAVFRLNG